jgi:putative oxidoreductase
MDIIEKLLHTDNDLAWTFLRIVAGIIIFPYGAQKLFGWFDDLGGGIGIKNSLAQLTRKKIPKIIGWLVIIGQSLGSLTLIFGFLGRITAAANFIIFTGALLVHSPDGWTMNWIGKKTGEGIEYFVMLLSILLIIVIKGSGAISIDRWLQTIR